MTASNPAPGQPRPFRHEDQQAVRALVLAGLGDHFGTIDPTMNPDLDDIWSSYVARGAEVLVIEVGGEIVATGTLAVESPATGRLVRMSVAKSARGQGLGRLLVNRLLDTARERAMTRVLVETNHDWWDAIGLYRACGFQEIGVWSGDRHFALDLE